MMTSGGGGYCDCGDPEAWKQFPNCELHMPKSSGEETSNEAYLAKLPSDLVERASHLYTYLLDYIFEVLSVENSDQLPFNLKPT
jgi:E3 ubiquitin-protein ligase UBR2